jgi:hypothetical protein
MKRFIPLLALFAAGVVASYAFASPPGGPLSSSSTSTSEHGKSGDHANACHPVNLKGTVGATTISLTISNAAGPRAKQIASPAALMVKGKVAVQAWLCNSTGASPTQTLFLRQLHVSGKPQPPTSP